MTKTRPYLTTLPNEFPDEWYLSYIYRLHLLTDLPRFADSVEAIFGTPLTLSHVAPTGLKKLVARIPPTLGKTVDFYLAKTTAFPYLKLFAFGTPEATTKAKYLDDQRPLSRRFTNRSNRAGLEKREPRVCLQCMEEDIATRGLAYYRRSHQIADIALCSIHYEPLRTSCAKCGPKPWPSYGMFRPGMCRHCKEDFRNQDVDTPAFANLEAEHQLTELVAKILLANLPLLDAAKLSATYKNALKRRDLMASRTKVAVRKLAWTISQHFGKPYLDELGLTTEPKSTATPYWVVGAIGCTKSAQPLDHCILIIFLFGSFENFLSSYRVAGVPLKDGDAQLDTTIEKFCQGSASALVHRNNDDLGHIQAAKGSPPSLSTVSSLAPYFSSAISRLQIAKESGVSVWHVNKFARENPDLEKIRSKNLYMFIFEKHKQTLQDFLTQTPAGTLKQFQVYRGTRNDWLERNENKWLLDQFLKQGEIKLLSRDETLTAKLKLIINAQPNDMPLSRITRSGILKRLSLTHLLTRPRTDLPQFWALLEGSIESSCQFAARRLATAYLESPHSRLDTETLMYSAGFSRRTKYLTAEKYANTLINSREFYDVYHQLKTVDLIHKLKSEFN